MQFVEEIKYIELTKGKRAIVDKEDYEFLNQWKWRFSTGYAIRTDYGGGVYKKTILMHRLINNTPAHLETDHINLNRLDNRRSNLRSCDKRQNQGNLKPQLGGTSRYKGVCFYKKTGKWKAGIKMYGTCKHLGYYDTQIEAAGAYDKAARSHFQEYALTNNASFS